MDNNIHRTASAIVVQLAGYGLEIGCPKSASISETEKQRLYLGKITALEPEAEVNPLSPNPIEGWMCLGTRKVTGQRPSASPLT